MPFFGTPGGGTPAPAANQPGEFTKLFGTLGSGGSNSPAPPPPPPEMNNPPRGTTGSFTRMLRLEEQPMAPMEPAFQEERRPAPGNMDYGLTPAAPTPAMQSPNPFAAPIAEPPPPPAGPQDSGVGITRLIQMLDGPSKPAMPRAEEYPAAAPRGPEPGVWTRTFGTLSAAEQPPAQPAAAPPWAPPPMTPPPPAAREPQFPATFNAPPGAPATPSGPSEFTRILDASRMREIAMKGGPGPGSAVPVPAPPPSFAPPPMTMPGMQPPAPPAGLGMMPQPGGFPSPHPPQPPAFPQGFGQQAGAVPSQAGAVPRQPGAYPPLPPMPAAPQIPPVKPPAPPAGKTQQYLLIMGAVIIVLLVAILVTVIFLMKH
jgi:hypothetical protein